MSAEEERTHLLKLQKMRNRWFSQEEFERLHYLNYKLFMEHKIEPLSSEEWKKALRKRMDLIDSVLATKADEYIRDGNKLYNFDEAARRENKLPAEILEGYMLKHYQSYKDMLADMQQPFGDVPTEARIRERFGDIIIYFILQEVIFLRHYGYINGYSEKVEDSPDPR